MKIKKEILNKIVKEAIENTLDKDSAEYGVQKLNENSFSRIFSKYFETGFIIISADRTCKAEKKRNCTDEEEFEQIQKNNENTKDIKKIISSFNFGFVPVYGGYKEKIEDPKTGKVTYEENPNVERSFLIPAVKKATTDERNVDTESLLYVGKLLCGIYNQDSFFYKPPLDKDGDNAYWIDRDGNVKEKFTGITLNNIKQQYYTFLKRNDPKTKKFTSINESKYEFYILEAPSGLSDARRRYGEIFIKVLE